jgi:putative oxidoreductase
VSDASAFIFLVARILFVAFFVLSARGHLTRGEMIVGYARSKGFPLWAVSGWQAGVWLTIGSASVALGIWPDVGALLLGLFVILTAFGIHRFWEIADAQPRQMEQMNFFRNMTYLGGALALFAAFVALGDQLRFSVTGPLLRF